MSPTSDLGTLKLIKRNRCWEAGGGSKEKATLLS